MNTVYSNPKGYHIHSPFAFDLVTRVMFRRATEAEKDLLKKWRLTEQHTRRMLLIRRLIEFFQPPAIWAPAWKKEMMELVLGGLQSAKNEYFDGHQPPGLTFSNDFVIADQSVGIPECIPETNCNSVWFIEDGDTSENGSYFGSFKNHPKVSQTYALKNCGIVIFNPRYQKQDFIIRGNYSF